MTKTTIAKAYLKHLENGDFEKVVALFNENGMVESPIYGLKKAVDFYSNLSADTSASKLHFKAIFEEKTRNHFALYFAYEWTLKNNEQVKFDVVDIIELDSDNKIAQLKIIYDTVVARGIIEKLKQ
ncbi:hypothetical protein GCM10011414_29020 [Croceivirga lutea]|uniref:nuclear transport factor 2 family protein n=1 Tax=Croceivirga lutea TaxID=1775167 RepID=UPI001639C47A|nr:nuclear transport factor 2 family protein [Croceivirga lutea]GGG57373.1 hypothetical protein GCM10011414_29020 [Croceivirga lutea]